MNTWWPLAVLAALVAAVLMAQRQPALAPLFRWLPAPLWCYLLPMLALEAGLLPRGHAAYPAITAVVLPVALALLLFGVDLPGIARSGAQALIAAAAGAAGIMLGAPISVWLLRHHLPPEAWMGAGSLAATWTGGTMNLLATRDLLGTPEHVFAPLVVVDAAIAYGWMALLVAAAAKHIAINRWLRAPEIAESKPPSPPIATTFSRQWRDVITCTGLAVMLVWCVRSWSGGLPRSTLIASAQGWVVLLTTTAALCVSLVPSFRRLGQAGAIAGYPLLYLVLAATGAQADVRALWSAPGWLMAGLLTVACHGLLLLLVGRWLRIPLGILATASQANVGGVVSAPMVGAVYHPSLVATGLLLAMAGNALGTYAGMTAAACSRRLLGF